MTVYDDGTTRPMMASLSFPKSLTVQNLTMVRVTDDNVLIYNGGFGSVRLYADLDGYRSTGSGDGFQPFGPSRMLDMKTDVGLGG